MVNDVSHIVSVAVNSPSHQMKTIITNKMVESNINGNMLREEKDKNIGSKPIEFCSMTLALSILFMLSASIQQKSCGIHP